MAAVVASARRAYRVTTAARLSSGDTKSFADQHFLMRLDATDAKGNSFVAEIDATGPGTKPTLDDGSTGAVVVADRSLS